MTEKTQSRFKRRPIRNFIILPEFQWPYIIRLLAIVNLTGVLMATTICTLFYYRYHASPIGDATGTDMISLSLMSILVEENLMDVVIPAFVIADVVSLALGLWLSLYFSRKISVPIFRIKKWAEVVASGDLTFRLKFRPGDDLKSLETACNLVSESYSHVIEDLKNQLQEAKLSVGSSQSALKTRTQQSLP